LPLQRTIARRSGPSLLPKGPSNICGGVQRRPTAVGGRGRRDAGGTMRAVGSPPASMALAGYRDLELVAESSWARLFRGVHIGLGRAVRVKGVLDAPAGPGGRAVESTVLVSGQPGVLTIVDVGQTGDGHRYVTTDYCSDGSYADLVAVQGPLRVAPALAVGEAVAGALQEAHQLGLVHGAVA